MHQIRIIVFVQVGKISFVRRFFPEVFATISNIYFPQKSTKLFRTNVYIHPENHLIKIYRSQ